MQLQGPPMSCRTAAQWLDCCRAEDQLLTLHPGTTRGFEPPTRSDSQHRHIKSMSARHHPCWVPTIAAGGLAQLCGTLKLLLYALCRYLIRHPLARLT
jgi:hypothetical protein